jgi:hypothetical protein
VYFSRDRASQKHVPDPWSIVEIKRKLVYG